MMKTISIEQLLSLSPKQFAGASKIISESQIRRMREKVKKYWSDADNRLRQSIRMTERKKDWSWNGLRRGGGNPKARVVITPEGRFDSVAEAALFFSITSEGLRHRIKHKWPGYAFDGEEIYSGPKQHNRCYRWVQTPQGRFFTLVAAAKVMGVTTVTVRSRIKRKVPGYAYLSQEDLA